MISLQPLSLLLRLGTSHWSTVPLTNETRHQPVVPPRFRSIRQRLVHHRRISPARLLGCRAAAPRAERKSFWGRVQPSNGGVAIVPMLIRAMPIGKHREGPEAGVPELNGFEPRACWGLDRDEAHSSSTGTKFDRIRRARYRRVKHAGTGSLESLARGTPGSKLLSEHGGRGPAALLEANPHPDPTMLRLCQPVGQVRVVPHSGIVHPEDRGRKTFPDGLAIRFVLVPRFECFADYRSHPLGGLLRSSPGEGCGVGLRGHRGLHSGRSGGCVDALLWRL